MAESSHLEQLEHFQVGKVHYLFAYRLKELSVYLQVSRTPLLLPALSLSEESSEVPWVVFLLCWNPHLINILLTYWYS